MPADAGVSALVFDFFGTLTEAIHRDERRAGHGKVAEALGVRPDDYTRVLHDTWAERARGWPGGVEPTLRWIAGACGVQVDDETLARAAEVRRSTQRGFVRLRAEAEPTLRTAKQRGFAVGLVSDCTSELPDLWPTLPLVPYVDAPVFSAVEGLKKPDPAIFRLVCDRLGVPPEECVYVGDGDSNELTGASGVGMRAIRLLGEDHREAYVFDRIDWSGPTIDSLGKVLDR